MSKTTCKIPRCKTTTGLHACYRCKRLACKHHLTNYSSPAPACSKCRMENTPKWKPSELARARHLFLEDI